MNRIAAISEAIVTELERQSETSGCVVDTNGVYAQVDGSAKLGPLAQAILRAIDDG
jgi:hypothetical protein